MIKIIRHSSWRSFLKLQYRKKLNNNFILILYRRRKKRRGRRGYRKKSFMNRKKSRILKAFRYISKIPIRKYKKRLYILKKNVFKYLKFSVNFLKNCLFIGIKLILN